MRGAPLSRSFESFSDAELQHFADDRLPAYNVQRQDVGRRQTIGPTQFVERGNYQQRPTPYNMPGKAQADISPQRGWQQKSPRALRQVDHHRQEVELRPKPKPAPSQIFISNAKSLTLQIKRLNGAHEPIIGLKVTILFVILSQVCTLFLMQYLSVILVHN